MNPVDHIDDYVNGLLSEKQMKQFDAMMALDPELKRLVESYDDMKWLSEGILEVELLEEVKKTSSKKPKEEEKVSRGNRLFMLMWAAIVVGIISGVYLYMNAGSDKDYYANAYTEPIWPIERTVSDKDYLQKGVSAYLQGDYDLATLVLQDSIENQGLGSFWLAEIEMHKKNPENALEYLEELDTNSSNYQRGLYLKVIALQMLDRTEEAKEILPLLESPWREKF